MTSTNMSAGKSFRAWLVFGGVLVIGLTADLWSKAAAFSWLKAVAPVTGHRSVIPGVMDFTLSTNPGMAFGFDKLPPWVIVAASVVAVVVVSLFFVTSPRKARGMHLALGLLLAGALGNLYDRLFSRVAMGDGTVRIHQVRDFIDLRPIYYPWIFNVADALLVVGVGLLLLGSFLQWRRERAAAK